MMEDRECSFSIISVLLKPNITTPLGADLFDRIFKRNATKAESTILVLPIYPWEYSSIQLK